MGAWIIPRLCSDLARHGQWIGRRRCERHRYRLILDELGVVEAREAAAAIYGLANGTGKARAARDGSLRDPKTWRTLILSTGELPIEGKLAEDKGRRAKLASLFECSISRPIADLGLESSIMAALMGTHRRLPIALSEPQSQTTVRQAQNSSDELLKEDPEALARHLRTVIDDFVANNIPQGSDGQVIRAAQRFGLIGAAGEIARAFGICPWDEGAAFEATAWALHALDRKSRWHRRGRGTASRRAGPSLHRGEWGGPIRVDRR